jgi:hypothetical protein
VGWLRCFRGVDTLSAMILLAEVVDFARVRLLTVIGNRGIRDRLMARVPLP